MRVTWLGLLFEVLYNLDKTIYKLVTVAWLERIISTSGDDGVVKIKRRRRYSNVRGDVTGSMTIDVC